MHGKKRKLLFLTGSRGEWGYIRPLLRLIESSEEFTYCLCVTNMHLLPSFGESIKEIENDGFKVDYKINMSIDGYNHFTQIKSLGIFLSSFADILASDKPDWIVLAGDRGEQLMGAIAGGYAYIPVMHIQAGERSGNIDGMARHAIGKFAHIHIASNEDARKRLLKLGEEEFRVFNVGAPQLDELVSGYYTSKEEIKERFNFDLNRDFMMIVQHPVTEEFDIADKQIEETMKAVNKISLPKIVILPNNDAGSVKVREGIEKFLTGEHYMFSNIKRQDYLGFLKYAKVLVGNSSSGLLEAPTFKTPAINLGRRQLGREQGINIINADFNEKHILSSLQKALSPEFKNFVDANCVNPYGDGKSSERILNILTNTEIDNQLIVKDITY
ncbi:MAG: UDP-N-acetylglucosamine 2-epimerase [Bacteroidia bacterium]|nr:UDP-N-acetylglucosamine 2-epimerase [Bacteroidia bacterium]